MSDIGERDDTDNQTVLAVERNATALVSTTADRWEVGVARFVERRRPKVVGD